MVARGNAKACHGVFARGVSSSGLALGDPLKPLKEAVRYLAAEVRTLAIQPKNILRAAGSTRNRFKK